MKKPDILRPYQFSIIDRYILRDFLKAVLSSMILFIAIYLFSLLINDIPYFISQMVDRKNPNVTMNKILTMYVNQIPHKVMLVSPLSFLFSTMYTMGNFYKNNEAVAYIGAGVYLFRLTFFILFLSFIYSLLLIPFTNYVVVPSYDKALALSRQMRNKTKRDRTTNFEIFGENNIYYFIKRYEPKTKIMYYPIIAKERKLQEGHTPYNTKAFFPPDERDNKPSGSIKEKSVPSVSPMDFFKKLYVYSTNFIKTDPSNNNIESHANEGIINNPVVQKLVETTKNLNNKELNGKMPPVRVQKGKNKVHENQSDLTIEDDFPVDLFKAPKSPKGPVNPELKRQKLLASLKSLNEPDMDFSKPHRTSDNPFPDLEHKYLYPGAQNRKKPSYQSLVDRSTTLINTDKLLDPSDKSHNNFQRNQYDPETPRRSLYDRSSTKESSDNTKTKGVRPTFADLYNLSKESTHRNQVYKRIQLSRRNASRINKDLSVKTPPLTYQPYATDQNTILESDNAFNPHPSTYPGKQSSKKPYQPKGLETTEERNLLDSPEFSALTPLNTVLKEQRVRAKSLPVSQFIIHDQTYREIPFTPYFDYRIDAEKAVWNNSLNKWMIYNATKYYWHKKDGLVKVVNLNLPKVFQKTEFKNTILKNISQDLIGKKIRSYYTMDTKKNVYKLAKSIRKLNKQEKSDILKILSIIPPNKLNRPATKLPDQFTKTVFENVILKSTSSHEIAKLMTTYYTLSSEDNTYRLKSDLQKKEEDKLSNTLYLLGYAYILNEVNDRPEHILIKNKEMDRLTFAEGMTLITRLKRARKKWKGRQIDLYSNKFAFPLSTFLVVLVGVTLGQFHSRKLIFINSLFKSILIFILYFVLFQLGVSLAKVLGFIPIFLAPWVGNIAFLFFGFYMMKKAKT
ncbi:MAG: hypothetical protein IEMM0008_0818 [bacterium]|nr:MAG: hypothetical protein IEMM0008_0818 [bacterium]